MHPVVKQLETFLLRQPSLGRKVYIARGAVVVGDVTIGDYSSIWHNTVLRGDINRILVGHHTNIQDNSVVHLADEHDCVIGDYVTVGHCAVVHACRVGDETVVGMGSVILDRAVIGKQCLVGARALVTQGAKIPDGSLVMGVPARVVRLLTREERRNLKKLALKYVQNARFCLRHRPNVTPAG